MNSEVKAKWLEALRSGNYTQCTGALHRPTGGFCCLGVLLDVNGEQWKPSILNTHRLRPLSQTSTSFLDDNTLAQYEISDIQQEYLTDMNDHYSNSFSEIADYIEVNL